jgi:hypothetical protein
MNVKFWSPKFVELVFHKSENDTLVNVVHEINSGVIKFFNLIKNRTNVM